LSIVEEEAIRLIEHFAFELTSFSDDDVINAVTITIKKQRYIN